MTTKTFYAERAFLPDGWANNVCIEVTDGVISSVVKGAQSGVAARLSGPVVPSVANLHSHAFQRAMAGLAEVSRHPDDSFWSWRDVMYKTVQELSPDDVRIIATQLYIDMLKGGYTQVSEFHYLHHQTNGKPYQQLNEMAQQLVRAADGAGLGITLLPVLYSYAGFGAIKPESGQNRFINDISSYLKLYQSCRSLISSSPFHQLGICFHSLRAVTQRQIEAVLEESDSDCPIHIHISEQKKEVQDCIAWSGQRPVEWLADQIGIDKRWCLVHATHLTQQEIFSVAKSAAVAGLCPTTEANLGDGIFPAVEYINARGRWGIGSDSHVSLSVPEELRVLEYGQRLRDQQRNRLHDQTNPHIGDFLYHQAVLGGNQASAVKLGIAAGCRADFLVLDHQDPFIAASNNQDLINRWIFASNNNLIRHVYVAGNQVIKDFRHSAELSSGREFTSLIKRLFA